MKPFDPVQLATPAFIVLVIAEMLFVRFTGRGRFEVRDTAASLMMGLRQRDHRRALRLRLRRLRAG